MWNDQDVVNLCELEDKIIISKIEGLGGPYSERILYF